MKQTRVTANDCRFELLEDGPDDGPLALCLHGFPDTAHTYRHLLPALAEAGFHAVAPWMRGYAPSAVPADGIYQTGALGTDACRLHEALGGDERAVLVGHDWGAAALMSAASHEPQRWRRLAVMALPPAPSVGMDFFRYDQLKRSFYIFLFQTPMAEIALSVDDAAFVDHLWADWSPGYDASWDVARVKEALATPENLAAAVGYYRALFDPANHDDRYAAAQAAAGAMPPQPALYLHGRDDGCLDFAGDVLPYFAEGSRQSWVDGAGHFLHLEQPDLVNKEIVGFLTA